MKDRAIVEPKEGDFLYVPEDEIPSALSMGAVQVVGDARLRIPSPLPTGVTLAMFRRWLSSEARLSWMAEYFSRITGARFTLTDILGFVSASRENMPYDEGALERIPLFVPRRDMDRVRRLQGVSWDRRFRLYFADESAPYAEIFPYLTPSMRAAWAAEQSVDEIMSSLVFERAIRSTIAFAPEGSGGSQNDLERKVEDPAQHDTGLDRGDG